MPLPRPARHVDVLLAMSVGLVGVVIAAYVRMPDFQRSVRTIAGEVEARFFGGDVAGSMGADDPPE